jgi:hypothetical protein
MRQINEVKRRSSIAVGLIVAGCGLGTADVTIGDAGTADATIKLNAAAKAKLKALGKDLPVRIEVKGADRFAAGKLTLTK